MLNYFSISLRKTSVHTHTTLQAHHWAMESINDKKSLWAQWSMYFLNLHCLFPKTHSLSVVYMEVLFDWWLHDRSFSCEYKNGSCCF